MTDNGAIVEAADFASVEQLAEFTTRAKSIGLRTWPARAGVAMVSNSRGDGRYAVTRMSCECRGHQGHGRCKHSALAIWLVDVERVNICRLTTIGANTAEVTMLPGPIPATDAA